MCIVQAMVNIDQAGTPTGAMPQKDMKDRPPDQVAAAEAVSGWLQAKAGWGPEAIERWLEGFWDAKEAWDVVEPELLSRARTRRSATSDGTFAS